jgi:hypothetical protein
MRNDFGIFILSHGRPDNIKTLKTFMKDCGYKGKWYVVIDNEDKTADRYYELYGDKVIMFDKLAVSKTFDTADTFQDRRAIVYARNVCFDLAEKLGLEYFLQLDDDYTSLLYRVKTIDGSLRGFTVKQPERLFNAMIQFLDITGARTVAFAQGGDLIGGLGGSWRKQVLRKAMNTLFCKTSNRFQFIGRINEDVNTYTNRGSRGELFLTITDVAIVQVNTQQGKGGMTSIYLDGGTYLKSFYSVMFTPSAVKLGILNTTFSRIHHRINWESCVPKIINEKYKKQ